MTEKLSQAQERVVELLQDGWCISYHTWKSPYDDSDVETVCLVEDRDYGFKYLNIATFRALRRKGVIECTTYNDRDRYVLNNNCQLKLTQKRYTHETHENL